MGTEPDAILRAARRALDEPCQPAEIPLWDGKAAGRIADILVGHLAG